MRVVRPAGGTRAAANIYVSLIARFPDIRNNVQKNNVDGPAGKAGTVRGGGVCHAGAASASWRTDGGSDFVIHPCDLVQDRTAPIRPRSLDLDELCSANGRVGSKCGGARIVSEYRADCDDRARCNIWAGPDSAGRPAGHAGDDADGPSCLAGLKAP